MWEFITYKSVGWTNTECLKIEDHLCLILLCYISILIPILYQSFNYFRSANHSTHNFIIQVDPRICGLLRPEKIWKIKETKQFISFKKCAKWERDITWCNPVAQMCPVLDSSSFVPIPRLPCKFPTILLLAFSLFELVAGLSQCLCSESHYLL